MKIYIPGFIKGFFSTKLLMGFHLFLLLSASSFSQNVANYGFSRVAEGWYSSPGGTTQLIGPNVDEQLSAATNIGFDFWYNGVKYTQFKVSSNGFITLNTSMTSPAPTNSLSSTSDQLIIAPLWDNLKTGTNGKIHYVLNSGDPANKQLIVEFYSMKWNASSSNDVITFKVTLFQTSNRIEFWYGAGTGSVSSGSASIGINGNASGTQQFISVTPTAPPTTSNVTENSTISSKPPAYDHYTFTPHHAGNVLNAPGNFVATPVSTSRLNISWTDHATNETGYVIYWSTSDPVIPGGTTNIITLPANSTSTSLTELGMNVTYFFKVFALKEALSAALTGYGVTQWGSPACAAISSPSNGTTGVCPSSVSLNWTSGGGSPTGYKLYFGTNNPPSNIVNGTDLGNVLTYNPGSLNSNTTYYWRIAPYNGAGTTSGCTVWSFTTANAGSTFTWTGNAGTSWHTASNWSGCTVPAWNSNVTIPAATNAPVITASAETGNLTIQSGGSLTISSNILHLHGNLTNNGTFTDNSNKVMMIGGTGTQSINGTISLNHLVINNALGVTINGATTVNGNLELASGTLTTNNYLTVNLNTGAIAGTGNGSISGNVTFSKTVNSAKYHMISCPVSGRTASDWNDDVEIKLNQYTNLYSYNETYTDTTTTVGWEAVNSLSTSLEDMKGYALYLEGARTIDVTGAYNHTASFSSTLTNTISGNTDSDGWHLIGNPYPSALDWEAGSGWTKTNIDNAIYFWDPVNDRYASYVNGAGINGGTRYIPSMQAFWIKVNYAGGTGTLGMNKNTRTTASNPALWKTGLASDLLRLKVSNGGYSDETIIRFTENATETFDSELDAYKLMNEGNSPSLYTRNKQTDYSINTLPVQTASISIPLHLKAATSGLYTIAVPDITSFDGSYNIILEDLLLNTEQDLKADPEYTFTANSSDTSGRFLIHFRKTNVTSVTNSETDMVNIYSFENTIVFDFRTVLSPNGYIRVSDLFGHIVAEVKNADISSGNFLLNLSGQSGIYIVRIEIEGHAYTQKVYLK